MSKFKGLMDLRKAQHVEPEPQGNDTAEAMSPAAAARKQRPPGKRSDPSFEQVTAYIRRRTYQQVKIALLQENQGREFSDLVETLLADWLKPRA